MEEVTHRILLEAVRGRGTHIDPLKALRGLLPEQARKKPAPDLHSVWETLYHMVFWQNLIFDAVEGKKVDWKAAEGNDWPSREYLAVETNWPDLLAEFEMGLAEAERLVQERELTDSIPSWPKASLAKAFLVLVQHSSYHLGQIVTCRRDLGFWPPSD